MHGMHMSHTASRGAHSPHRPATMLGADGGGCMGARQMCQGDVRCLCWLWLCKPLLFFLLLTATATVGPLRLPWPRRPALSTTANCSGTCAQQFAVFRGSNLARPNSLVLSDPLADCGVSMSPPTASRGALRALRAGRPAGFHMRLTCSVLHARVPDKPLLLSHKETCPVLCTNSLQSERARLTAPLSTDV